MIVVTRYFGGILLGTGGLVRAYTQAASDAVAAAGEARYESYTEFEINCDYSEYGKISFELEKYTKKIIGTDFEERVTIKYLLLSEEKEKFEKKLTEMFGGRINPTQKSEGYYCPEASEG